MKTFKDQAAQGDVYICRISELPPGVKPVEPSGARTIVAHSESGHNHVIVNAPGLEVFADAGVFYARVPPEGAELKHEKEGPTKHESYMLPQGLFMIGRQREFRPDGWTQVQD